MKIDAESVRGTNDFLPQEMIMRDYVKRVILDTYRKNGFMHISTPVLENINLLCNSDGGDNLKLIFKILKRGEKLKLEGELKENDLVDIGLRYDLTVPLARFYANNQNNLPKPFKSVQIDYAFRAERPQRGRNRQFTQCDIDILGDSTENAEIEIINVAGETLENLGFKNFVFKVNDRRILNHIIQLSGFPSEDAERVCIVLDKRDKIGVEGIKKELLSYEYAEQNIDKLTNYIDLLTEKGLDGLKELNVDTEITERLTKIIRVTNELANYYKVEFDCTIIRGQGYYTSTVMEVYLDGFAGASGGGGRYDNMIGKIINVPVSAVGFSIGYERVCLILKEQNKIPQMENIVLIYNKDDDIAQVLKMRNSIKSDNINVHTVVRAKNLTNQLSKLKENGYTKFMIYPYTEIKSLN